MSPWQFSCSTLHEPPSMRLIPFGLSVPHAPASNSPFVIPFPALRQAAPHPAGVIVGPVCQNTQISPDIASQMGKGTHIL